MKKTTPASEPVLVKARACSNPGCGVCLGLAEAIRKGEAPTDDAADRAWTEIMRLATDHALIVQAYSGVATLAIPAEQRKAGLRCQVLRAVCMSETKSQKP